MSDPTVADLYETRAVTDAHLNDAIDVYLSGIPTDSYVLPGGHVLNLRAAIEASKLAREIRDDVEASELRRRNAVRSAILLATVTVR